MLARRSAPVAALLLSLACRPQPEVVTPPVEPAAPPVAATPARKFEAPKPVAPAKAPVDLMPEGTGVVLTVASVQHLLRVVDIGSLIAKYRVQYDQAVAFVAQATGHDLLDPARWPDIGVNPDGPIGFALFNTDAGAGCGFFTLSDPAKFREFLDRIAGKIGGPLVSVYEDRGIVLAHEPDSDSVLVLRDGFAFYVIRGNQNRAPYDYARELATVDPARGLSATQRWQKALGAATPHDLVAFVDVGGMVAAEAAARKQRDEHPEPNWAETELQRLREQGAAPEDIAKWEKLADEQRAGEALFRENRRREQEFMTSVFGALGPMVFELSLSDKAVKGTIRAQAPESAMPRRIALNRGTPPLAITAAGERVIFGASASVEVAEAVKGLEALLKVNGPNLDIALARLNVLYGVDAKAMFGALAGTASFALTVKDPAALLAAKSSDKLFGFTAAIGLTNRAEIEALLATLAKNPPWGMKVRRAGKGYTVAVPNWRDVHVAIAGDALTLSTDAEFSRRVDRGANGPIDRTLPTATVPVVTAREAAGVLLMDYVAPFVFFASRSMSDYQYDPTQNQPYWKFQDVPHEQIDKVPQSAAYKAKLKEWRAIDAKIRKHDEARERAQAKTMLAVADSIGALALNLRETPDGLVIDGGQFFGTGGLARAIELGIEGTGRSGDDAVQRLYEERGKVEAEMQEVRVRDVEKALGVRQAQ
jgi:hypothetical protein